MQSAESSRIVLPNMQKHKKWLIISLIANLVLVGLLFGRIIKNDIVSSEPQKKVIIDKFPNKALVAWIDKLETKENCPIMGIVDNNGLRSYGPLCFQKATFVSYIRGYKMLPYTEDAELMNFIADESVQKELAYRMISEKYGNWQHWRNSTLKTNLGLPPK